MLGGRAPVEILAETGIICPERDWAWQAMSDAIETRSIQRPSSTYSVEQLNV
jgi:hypothetical protein